MKKKKLVNRVIYYRRASWNDQNANESLQSLLSNAHQRFTSTADRDFGYFGSTHVNCIDWGDWDDGLVFHLGTYVPDQHQSTISKPAQTKKGTIGVQGPPEKSDFMKGDIFFLVRENHVLLLPSGAREPAVRTYVYQMLKKIEKKEAADSLELRRIADIDKFKLVAQHGVAEVRLNSSLYDATLQYQQEKSMKDDAISALWNSVKTRFSTDKKFAEIKESDNLHIDIGIRFDGREASRKINKAKIGFGDAGRKQLIEIANAALNDDEDDGFCIRLGNGQTLTPDEIRVKSSVKLAETGSSVDHQQAWSALAAYYTELKKNGTLEQ